jgi:translocation and assembly module TamB
VRIDDAFGAPQVNGTATATAMTIGGLRLDTAEATATVEGGATRFTAAARGPDLDLSGGGSLAGAAGQQTVRIDTLAGTAFRFPVQLNQPVTISLDGSQSRIAGATLALGGGTVRVDGAVAPRLDLTVVVESVAASVANTFAPELGAEGAVSGRATVTGDPASPEIAWEATWSGLSTAATRNAGLPGLSLAARGDATRTATDIAASLTGAGLSLAISGQAPFSGPGLNIRAEGDAPLALLALESDRELRLAGTARVNIAVTGSAAAPAINGSVVLADATLADTDSGFGITGANGRIDFDGQQATVRQLTGNMGQGGQATVTGTVAVGGPGMPADLAIRVVNGRYADGTTINTTFNADLAVSGPLLGNGTISGRVDLGRTEIQLPDRVGSATAIEVRHVNPPAGFSPPTPRLRPGQPRSAGPGPTGGGLQLDVQLTGNSGVFVRGFGIDAELGGALRVGGSTGNPQAVGGLQMRWGRIEVLGRRFEFTRGQITFSGNLTPYVDFAATTGRRTPPSPSTSSDRRTTRRSASPRRPTCRRRRSSRGSCSSAASARCRRCRRRSWSTRWRN